MNIAEILKDCPKGTKLYSPIYGEVKLWEIRLAEAFPITVCFNGDSIESFTADGKLYNNCDDAECILFPSKENRDWSTFKVPKKEYNFKAFDKVLVRDLISDTWSAALFSHKEENQIFTIGHIAWEQCVPYKGNEHLLGTINPA